jgi:hypothetical protein
MKEPLADTQERSEFLLAVDRPTDLNPRCLALFLGVVGVLIAVASFAVGLLTLPFFIGLIAFNVMFCPAVIVFQRWVNKGKIRLESDALVVDYQGQLDQTFKWDQIRQASVTTLVASATRQASQLAHLLRVPVEQPYVRLTLTATKDAYLYPLEPEGLVKEIRNRLPAAWSGRSPEAFE